MFRGSNAGSKRRGLGLNRRCSLEPLESRCLLSVVAWTGGGGDHLWSNAANWSSGELPTSADAVTIASGAAVTCDTDATVASLVNGGTLTLQDTKPNDDTKLVGDITNAGTISVRQGSFALNPHGAHPAQSFTNSGTVEIAGGATFNVGATFNPDVGTINGAGVFVLEDATANFDSGWAPATTVYMTASTVTVNGTLTNTQSLLLADSTINANVANHGTMAVLGLTIGRLRLALTSTIHGQLTNAAGSSVILGGDQDFYDNLNLSLNGDSPQEVVAGPGSLTVASGLTNSGTVMMGGLSGQTLIVNVGPFANAGTLTYDGGDYNGFIVAAMANSGTIHVTHGFLEINLQGNSTSGWTPVDPSYTFTNTGTIQLDGTDCSIGGLASPDNLGTSLLGTGTLGIHNVAWSVADWTLPTTTAVLQVADSSVTLTGDAGPAAGTLTIPTGDMLMLNNSTITGDVALQGTLVGWTASTIAGGVTVASGGALSVGIDQLPYPLQYEDCAPSSSTALALTVSGNVVNDGTIGLYNTCAGSTLTVQGTLHNAAGGTIHSDAGLFAADGSTISLDASISNVGAIAVGGCDLAINGGAGGAGKFAANGLHGTIDVGHDRTLTIGGGGIGCSENAAITMGNNAIIDFAGTGVSFDGASYLAAAHSSTIHVRGSFSFATTDEADFSMPGTVLFDGASSESLPQHLYLTQEDVGNTAGGYAQFCFPHPATRRRHLRPARRRGVELDWRSVDKGGLCRIADRAG